MTSQDIETMLEDAKNKRQKEIEDLKSRSRPLHELVATEYFTVEDVVAESYPVTLTPYSEATFSGFSNPYQGGYVTRLYLKVSSERDIPVTTLNFEGLSVVRAGDYISAMIPRFNEKRISTGLFTGINQDYTFYFDRDYTSQESAIELAILSDSGEVLRKDRAVDYMSFINE